MSMRLTTTETLRSGELPSRAGLKAPPPKNALSAASARAAKQRLQLAVRRWGVSPQGALARRRAARFTLWCGRGWPRGERDASIEEEERLECCREPADKNLSRGGVLTGLRLFAKKWVLTFSYAQL